MALCIADAAVSSPILYRSERDYRAVSDLAKPEMGAAEAGGPEARVNVLYDTRLPELSRWRRAQIPVIAGVVGGLIAAIGPTLRFECLGEDQVNDWMGAAVRASRRSGTAAFFRRLGDTGIAAWL